MPTIIDQLIVTLGLDPKDYKKGAAEVENSNNKTRKSADRTGKDVERAAKRGADGVAMLRNEVMRLGAAYVGLQAIKAFVETSTRADAAAGRMAKTLDMSIQGLSQWQQVAEQFGVSGDAVAGDMDRLTQSMQLFSHGLGGGESLKFFRALNVQTADASGKMRDVREIMLDVADAMQKLDPAEAKFYGTGMGFSPDTISLMLEGRKALQESLDLARKNALTDDDKRAARERTQAWSQMSQAFGRVARDVENEVTPTLVKLLNLIRDNVGPAAAILGSLGTAMIGVSAVRFGKVLGEVAQLGGALGGLAGRAGLAISVLGRLSMVASAGMAGYAAGSFVEKKTGWFSKLGGWIYDKTSDHLDFKGGYVPGTIRGLGNMGGHGAAPVAPGGDLASKQQFLRGLEQQWGLPAGLLDADWVQESNRGRNMVSPKGAMGDFQQMPATAKAYGITNPMDFQQSATAAARMFADLLRQYGGSLPTALAAYNYGAGNLKKSGGVLPTETANYVRQVMARMGAAGGGGTSNETNIQNMTIVTQATDAQGIARDIQPALLAAQANVGLQ